MNIWIILAAIAWALCAYSFTRIPKTLNNDDDEEFYE
jgi:hypothetical protein